MNRGTQRQQLAASGPRYCLGRTGHVLKEARRDLLQARAYATAADAPRLLDKIDAALAAVRSAIKSHGGASRNQWHREIRADNAERRFWDGCEREVVLALPSDDDGCPHGDPDCLSGNGDCHDACSTFAEREQGNAPA